MRLRRAYGTHLPVLIKAMQLPFQGPVLELGSGLYSTPFLHWACFLKRRDLVTYESQPAYARAMSSLQSHWHSINLVSGWEEVDFTPSWGLAFVDHEPAEQRGKDLEKLTHAQYVVAHDTERYQMYGYEAIDRLFKYRYKYKDTMPYTTIMSNYHDVSQVML